MGQYTQPNAEGMITLRGRGGAIGKCVGLLVFALFWNGVTWFLLVWIISSGDMRWWMYLFFTPFVLIGLVTLGLGIGGLVARGMIHSRMMPAVVKISRQPLRLGETFRVSVSQRVKSPLSVQEIKFTLKGLEWVQYRRGTTTYTDEHVICEQTCRALEQTDAHPMRPMDGACEFTVPADSMHSFEARDNQIRWSLELRTVIDNWPDCVIEYPITVIPRLVPTPGAGR